MPQYKKDLLERLGDKFAVGDECWIWHGALTRQGYPNVRHEGSNYSAHRLVYELLVGPIPEDCELDHLCRTPACVRPSHLEPVSHQENVRRGVAASRKRAKKHCPRGHMYAGENLLVDEKGARRCVECRREQYRDCKRRAKEASRG